MHYRPPTTTLPSAPMPQCCPLPPPIPAILPPSVTVIPCITLRTGLLFDWLGPSALSICIASPGSPAANYAKLGLALAAACWLAATAGLLAVAASHSRTAIHTGRRLPSAVSAPSTPSPRPRPIPSHPIPSIHTPDSASTSTSSSPCTVCFLRPTCTLRVSGDRLDGLQRPCTHDARKPRFRGPAESSRTVTFLTSPPSRTTAAWHHRRGRQGGFPLSDSRPICTALHGCCAMLLTRALLVWLRPPAL